MGNAPGFVSCVLVLAGLCSAEAAHAQEVQRFDTFSNAMQTLLGLGPAGCAFPNTAAIGHRLARYCKEDSHLFAGGVISGGLYSDQPTRTISQFSSHTRSEPAAGDEAKDNGPSNVDDTSKVNSYVDSLYYPTGVNDRPDVFANVLNQPDHTATDIKMNYGELSLFGSFSYENIHQSATKFESAADYDYFTGSAGLAFQVSPDMLIGASFNYTRTDGTLIGPDNIDSRDLTKGTGIAGLPFLIPSTNSLDYLVDYEDTCGVSKNGKSSEDDTGISLFGSWNFGSTGFLQGQIGASRNRYSYTNGRCFLQLSDTNSGTPDHAVSVEQIYAGILHGATDGYQVDAQLSGGYDFELAEFVIGPRATLSFEFNHINPYSETETAAAPSKAFPFTDKFPTGASLEYDSQNIQSATSRVGIAISRPFLTERGAIVPFMQFDYIHEFANDQRNITASFVEDKRTKQLKFSFLTNAPDRDYFEIAGGAATRLTNSTTAYARGSVSLGNSLYDGYAVEAGLAVKF